MAGGNWTAQNKVRPGIYINFSTRGSQALTLGSRGTAAICRALSWGPVREIVTVDAGADTTGAIGWGITTEQARFLREMFKGTGSTGGPTKVLLYRPEAVGAAAASAALGEGGVTVTALYPGVRAMTSPSSPLRMWTSRGPSPSPRWWTENRWISREPRPLRSCPPTAG